MDLAVCNALWYFVGQMNQPEQPRTTQSPAEIYEAHMVPAMFALWVPSLLDMAALESNERLLDVACGTGIVARHAVSRVGVGGQVVGLDINGQMLAMAQTQAPSVRWVRGNGIALPFAPLTFDVLVCQQGLQFLPERSAALREMQRVLARGGRLAIAVWCALESSPGHHALVNALAKNVGTQAAELMHAAFRLGEAEAIRFLLEDAGFRGVRIRQEERRARFPSPESFARWVVQGSVVGRSGVVVRPEALAALIDEVSQALQPYVEVDGLVFPMQAQLAVAHA
jgi:ubiquinone/menaquinone biosynthesis C-methylase UbiE